LKNHSNDQNHFSNIAGNTVSSCKLSKAVAFICRFLSQTGLVSIEHQMREMDLVPKDQGAKHKET